MQRIAKDGNCYFRAISHQLELNSIFIPHKEIREKTCEEIKTKSEIYSNYIIGLCANEYAETMSKDGIWADYVAIYASSQTLNFSLNVFISTGLRNQVNPGKILELNIFWINENHFESIIDLSILLEQKIIVFSKMKLIKKFFKVKKNPGNSSITIKNKKNK